jgi:hypothetical protein
MKLLISSIKSLRRNYVEEENPMEQKEYPKTGHPQASEKYDADHTSDHFVLH